MRDPIMSNSMIKKLSNNRMLYIAGFLCIAHSFMSVYLAFLLEDLVDIAGQGDLQQLYTLFQRICLYVILAAVITRLSCVQTNRYVSSYNTVLRSYLLEQLLEKPINSYQKLGMGAAIAMLENDVSLIEQHYLRAKLKLISLSSTFIIGFFSMFVINWKIALVVILTSLIPIIFSSIYSKPLEKLQRLYSDSYANYMTALKNTLANYSLIKVFHIENKILTDVDEQCSKQEHDKKIYRIRMDELESYTSLMSFAVIIAVFGVGTLLIMQGTAQIGSLLAFIQLTNYVLSPIEGISIQIGHISSCQAIMKRFDSLIQKQEKTIGVNFPIHPTVTLKNVSYRYAEKEVLSKITMSLERGKRYVVVGSNGSGKSTLMRIISRFYEDYTGDVYYGPTEARQIDSTSFFQNVILLQQEVLILKDTVRNNIQLYDCAIDESEVSRIVNALHLDELFSKSTICLDNGDNLSGGEKQRIAAARALIRHPYILLLDESFSALDPSLRNVVENLLLPSASIVVSVSHDCTSENLQKYDEIIYLDAGKIVAKGPLNQIGQILHFL